MLEAQLNVADGISVEEELSELEEPSSSSPPPPPPPFRFGKTPGGHHGQPESQKSIPKISLH